MLGFCQGVAYLVYQIPFYFIEIKEPAHRPISMPQFYPGVLQQLSNRVLCYSKTNNMMSYHFIQESTKM